MSRRRMVDPDIWQDEKFAQLDFAGRLFFIGLITHANDYGKLRGNYKILKSMIFPYDDNSITIEDYIKQLNDLGVIQSYEINEEKFIKIRNWHKHRTLTYKGKDNIPEPLTNTEPTLNQPLTNTEPTLKSNRVELSKVKIIEDIVCDLNSLLNSSYKATTPKTRELIEARIKEGYTVEDFKKVHRTKLKEWGKDEKWAKFLRPITLYSNKFESYLNQEGTAEKETEIL